MKKYIIALVVYWCMGFLNAAENQFLGRSTKTIIKKTVKTHTSALAGIVVTDKVYQKLSGNQLFSSVAGRNNVSMRKSCNGIAGLSLPLLYCMYCNYSTKT